jgi:hypothetical protein
MKQVGAPTVPSAVFKGSNEFEDFWFHRSVTVCHNFFIFQVTDFLSYEFFDLFVS